LHIVLHNEIRSTAFDVTTCQSNLTEYGLARRRISGHGRWECDCQSHQSLHRVYRCAKQYANDCSQSTANSAQQPRFVTLTSYREIVKNFGEIIFSEKGNQCIAALVCNTWVTNFEWCNKIR